MLSRQAGTRCAALILASLGQPSVFVSPLHKLDHDFALSKDKKSLQNRFPNAVHRNGLANYDEAITALLAQADNGQEDSKDDDLRTVKGSYSGKSQGKKDKEKLKESKNTNTDFHSDSADDIEVSKPMRSVPTPSVFSRHTVRKIRK